MARVATQGSAPADFLALGDSYTIGEGVSDDCRWPVQLAAALRSDGIAVAHPHFIAKSSWTTDELSAAINDEQAQGQLQPPYGLVSLLIGVNDQYRGHPVDGYITKFSMLLDRAIAFAGGDSAHVLVVSIPDWGTTPFAQSSGRDRAQIARELDGFNAVAEAICVQRGVTWVDITDLTRQPELALEVVADGLHPSSRMYGLWAQRIREKIRK
jgi:lysophospholipase L1-like esterase